MTAQLWYTQNEYMCERVELLRSTFASMPIVVPRQENGGITYDSPSCLQLWNKPLYPLVSSFPELFHTKPWNLVSLAEGPEHISSRAARGTAPHFPSRPSLSITHTCILKGSSYSIPAHHLHQVYFPAYYLCRVPDMAMVANLVAPLSGLPGGLRTPPVQPSSGQLPHSRPGQVM